MLAIKRFLVLLLAMSQFLLASPRVLDLSPIPRTEKTPLEKILDAFIKKRKENQLKHDNENCRERLQIEQSFADEFDNAY